MCHEIPHFDRLEFLVDGRDRICRITNCPMEFNAEFKCTTFNDETICKLRVKPMPEFSDGIKDLLVKVGEVAVFRCDISDPEVDAEWFLNGAPVTESEKFSFACDSETSRQLTIQDCQVIDDGSVAIQLTEGVSSTAKLMVDDGSGKYGSGDDDGSGKMSFGKGNPKILCDPFINAVIKVGKSHTWTVEIVGKPFTDKKWFFENKELSNNERINIVNEDAQTTITISDALRKQTGPYRLYVENSNGSDEASAELVVLGKPAKPQGPLEVLEIFADKCTLAWKPPMDDGGCPIREYEIEMLCPKTKTWKKIGRCPPETPLRYPVEVIDIIYEQLLFAQF